MKTTKGVLIEPIDKKCTSPPQYTISGVVTTTQTVTKTVVKTTTQAITTKPAIPATSTATSAANTTNSAGSISTGKKNTVYVKPHRWECTNSKGDRGTFEIRAWGLMPDSEPAMVRFLYEMPLLVELDNRYVWDETGARKVFDRLCQMMRENKGNYAIMPVSFEYIADTRPLYSAYLRTAKAIRMRFNSWKGLDDMCWMIGEKRDKQGVVLNPDGTLLWHGQDKIRFQVRNQKVTPDISMLIEREMETTEWFEFEGTTVRGTRVSRLEKEFVVLPQDVRVTPESVCAGWTPKLKEMIIDAEAFAERSTAMPKHSNPSDAAFCVGVLLRNRDGSQEMHAFCSVKKPNTPRGVTIHFYEEEEHALKAFSDFIRDRSPDVIGSHNGMGWDEFYLYQRYTRNDVPWPNDSRLLNHTPILIVKEWESSAFAGMKFMYITRPGIVHNDLLPWSKRSLPRLDSYKLDYLDKKYGGAGKLLGDEDIAKVDLDDVQDEEAPEEDYLEAHKIFEYYARGDPEEMKRIVIYCVGCLDDKGGMVLGDCGITLRLMDHLNMWMQLTQMAKVSFVQPFDVFTRGMQIRTFNQAAREAYKRGMFITCDYPPIVPVKGAHVFPPMRGLWNMVFVFDFKGLYPSIIRRYNLDQTTYVPEEGDPNYDPGYDDPTSPKYVSDDRCHLFNWDEVWYVEEYKEWQEGKKKSSKKVYSGPTMVIPHRHRILKEPRGILPSNLDKLSDGREVAKGKMKKYPEGSHQYKMADQDQNAIKLNMNSAYGGLGAKNGMLRCHPLAAIITYMARCAAQKMATYFEKTYGAKIVYGDSVAKDTPILVRTTSVDGIKTVKYMPVCELGKGEWRKSNHGGDKLECAPLPTLEVWTEKGFTEVKKVIKHKCGKAMVRVRTQTGVVDVTTDHSLLSISGEKVKPSEVQVGSRLMHSDLPNALGNIKNDDNVVVGVAEYNSAKKSFTNKLEAAEYYREKSVGGYNMQIRVVGTEYIVEPCYSIVDGDKILGIDPLPIYDGDVYDLETENHHFSAGIGRMIVHNTDSAFIWFPPNVVEREKIKESQAATHAWGNRMAKEGTALFEKPMELEFEKVFEWLLLVNKKQYIGPTIPAPDFKTGIAPPVNWNFEKMISRGLMFVKRAQAPIMQEVQKELALLALREAAKGTPLEERQRKAYELLEAFSYRMMSHGVPEKELTITQKIGQNYKQAGNALNVYRQHLVAAGKVVNPGDRMPFILIKREDLLKSKTKQGHKMELPELRKTTGKPIDYLYYLEKRGVKPYDSVLKPGFQLGVNLTNAKKTPDGRPILAFMEWHVKYLKTREKLQDQLKKAYIKGVMNGERDYRHLDARARRQRRKLRRVVACVRGTSRENDTMRRWCDVLVEEKGIFGEDGDEKLYANYNASLEEDLGEQWRQWKIIISSFE